ncbi:tripartite tricarboxylate transporter substrate binding protein [Bacillus sp. H-16]|uniref:tripartite tricarboxylate transporter substrate binding protein n=1 Tax=Alteribacter salitolerans TaxID=2912333 RepID=UPI001962F4C6|nr:tripartite tricarboxylate transporter substrate binding protein [Alteribacter salitolerans]MBM7095761.1 tripartite tricarboxylate transporter substrate binding protein [Alteribacter salitolerans]
MKLKLKLFLTSILLVSLTLIAACGDGEVADNEGNEDGAEASEGMPDGYPERPIDVVVAYAAGGGTDVGARVLVSAAEQVNGDNFVVQNREGAGGELGFNYMTSADPDGYTIGFINLPTFVSLPQERPTEYGLDDIEPIMLHVYDPAVLVVKPESGLDTLEEFLDYSEENPGKITVANNGTGASNHIIAAHFEHEAGIELNHVPFDGTNELVTALRGGHVMAGVAKISEVAAHLDSGEIIALASMTDERLEELEDVPTLMENDIDVIGASGRGIVAPAGTDPEIIDYLHEVFKEAMESEEHINQADNISLPLRYMGPEEFGEFIHQQDEDNKQLRELLDL